MDQAASGISDAGPRSGLEEAQLSDKQRWLAYLLGGAVGAIASAALLYVILA
jgi:hypothetical protein